MDLVQSKQRLDQIEVFERLAFARPAAAFPTESPFRNRVETKFAVRDDGNFSVIGQQFISVDQRAKFHPIVRGFTGLVAAVFGFYLTTIDPDHAPAAWTGIRTGTAVGEDTRVGTVGIFLQHFGQRQVLGSPAGDPEHGRTSGLEGPSTRWGPG